MMEKKTKSIVKDITGKIQNEEIYENIIFNRNVDSNIIVRALDIVRDFIIENGRILVGGNAIDFALRKKGRKLYKEYILPDYDFRSPIFHVDAYNIATLLHMSDMPNVSVINALHPLTMRVRVNFHVVADVTYIASEIYERIETINYKGLRIIHPYFQIMDQYSALSFPFIKVPREQIFFRWKKDIERNELLQKSYPLVLRKNRKSVMNYIKAMKYFDFTIPLKIMKDECLGGFPALIYWLIEARKDGFTLRNGSIYNSILKRISFKIDDKNMNVRLPTEYMIVIFSDSISLFINNFMFLFEGEGNIEEKKGGYDKKMQKEHKIEWYNSFMEIFSYYAILNDELQIYNNRGLMLDASQILEDIWVCNLQPILLYSILDYNICTIYKREEITNYFVMYDIARSIVAWASDEYVKTENPKYLRYLPTTETYGKFNYNIAHLIAKRKFLMSIGELERPIIISIPKIFHFNRENQEIPEEYYQFDPLRSDILLFQNPGRIPRKPELLFYQDVLLLDDECL
jgi:hypothetical protein